MAWFAGCVSAPTQDLILLRPDGGNHWSVTYRLARPMPAIIFVRTPDEARSRRWTFVSPGFEIVQVDGQDVIRRIDGAKFSSVRILVPATYVPLPKDYAPFAPFSDGGLLIHSGRFHACATAADGTGSCDGPWMMQITPPKNGHTIVAGELQVGSTRWLDSNSGTMIYVGRAMPAQSPHYIGIVDPALPPAITESMTEILPRLMAFYADRLPPLQQRLMLFMSFDTSYEGGHGREGGALPGQVFMHFYGPFLEDQAPEDATWGFTHEIGHAFQHDVAGVREASWIHEGAAEAFTYIAFKQIQGAPNGYLEGRWNRAFDECHDALSRGTLATAADRGEFAMHYHCGLIIYLAIDAAVKASSAGQEDLFSTWTTLIDATGNGGWDNESYPEYLQAVVGASFVDQLRALITGDRDEATTALLHLSTR